MVVGLLLADSFAAGKTIKVVVTGFDDIDTAKYDVVLNDSSLPAIEKVETVGNKLIKVTFTEPMAAGISISDFKIDNKVKSLTPAFVSGSFNKVVNLTLNTALADGEYTLTVAADVKDFAGNALGSNSNEFAVAAESATPAYTVLEASQEMVKVQFDREPKSVDTLYWKSGSVEKHSAAGVVDADDVTIYSFTFTAAKRLANGENTVYMHKVTDYSGNKTENEAFDVTAVIDTERPEFVSLTQKTATTFDVKFTKAVTADKTNYTIEDAEGVAVTVASAAVKATDDTIITITTGTLDTTRNPFTFAIKNVIDTTYLAN